MQRVDIVIALLAAVALGGSIVGVVLYEPPAESSWDVTFSEESVSGRNAGSFAVPGQTNWPLEQENLTRVEFQVQVSGDAAVRLEDVNILVTITPPEGAGDEQSVPLTLPQGQQASVSTSAPVVFTLRAPPQDLTSVEAENATAALPAANMTGTGAWNIQAARQGSGTLPGQETFTVTITAGYRYYVGTAKTHVPELSPVA